ncbi:MAG: hypothetical protein ACI9ES_003055, partial [Oceanospirillaceae bacterium]
MSSKLGTYQFFNQYLIGFQSAYSNDSCEDK